MNQDDVHFNISGPDNLVVFADKQRVEQVIVNLINNALKYSPEKDAVKIQISLDKDQVKVSVTDYGIGIDKRELPSIFDRFYRVVLPGNNYPGLGLGLFLASEIVKKHKGQLGVESESGNGSTFWFSIPLHAQENID